MVHDWPRYEITNSSLYDTQVLWEDPITIIMVVRQTTSAYHWTQFTRNTPQASRVRRIYTALSTKSLVLKTEYFPTLIFMTTTLLVQCATPNHVAVTWWFRQEMSARPGGRWSTRDIWWQQVKVMQEEPSLSALMAPQKRYMGPSVTQMELCFTSLKVTVVIRCFVPRTSMVESWPVSCAPSNWTKHADVLPSIVLFH